MLDFHKPRDERLNVLSDILRKDFARRKQRNRQYTLRSYAKDLKISPSYMSKLLNDKVTASSEMTKKILKALNLQLTELATIPAGLMDPSKYVNAKRYSYHMGAVLEFVRAYEPVSLSKVVDSMIFEFEEIQEAVKALMNAGMIKAVDDNKLGMAEVNYHQFLTSPDLRLQYFNEQKAAWLHSLLEHPEETHNRTVCIPASDETAKAIFNEAEGFLEKVREIMDADQKQTPQRVYTLAFSLFPNSTNQSTPL